MNSQTEHTKTDALADQIMTLFSGVEVSSESVFVTDIKGQLRYVNQAFLDLNGWSEEEALEHSISDIPHSKKVVLNLVDSLNERRSWSMRHQILSTHNSKNTVASLIWVTTSVDPVFETQDQVSGYIGIQRVVDKDVIRELQVKKELSEALGLAIRQDKSLKALKKTHETALQKFVTKSEVLAQLTDQIREPLNNILGTSASLQKTSLTAQQSQLTNTIQQSGNLLIDLINNILDLPSSQTEKTSQKIKQSNDEHFTNHNTQTESVNKNTVTDIVSVLNQNTLGNIRSLQRDGTADILEKIIGLYLENSTNIISELLSAIEEMDAKRIRSAAHSLKSSSANVGADNLAEICKKMELLGKNNQLENIVPFYNQLVNEYEATCKALQHEIG